jgi:hypothetical protein
VANRTILVLGGDGRPQQLQAGDLLTLPAGFLRGQIDGLVLSTAGSSTTLSYAAGCCRDSTDAASLTLAAGTKLLAATWALGSGSNGLDTGAVANSTWYHVWAISKAGGANPDILFSLSATAPTMPSTAYVLKRRIGAVKTDGSGKITLFHQMGDTFLWDAGVQDVNTTVGATATLFTCTVPTGVQVSALLDSLFGTAYVLITSPDQSDEAPTGFICTLSSSAQGGPLPIRTNTSAQLRVRGNGAGKSIQWRTIGWIDPRGRDA